MIFFVFLYVAKKFAYGDTVVFHCCTILGICCWLFNTVPDEKILMPNFMIDTKKRFVGSVGNGSMFFYLIQHV